MKSNFWDSSLVNGSWSEWTSWSLCDLSKCGEQSERRNRFCNDPKPQAGGEQCMGDDFETISCRYGQPRPCDKSTFFLVFICFPDQFSASYINQKFQLLP